LRFLRCVPMDDDVSEASDMEAALAGGGAADTVATTVTLTTESSFGTSLSILVPSRLVLVLAVFVDSREEFPGDSNGDTLDSSKPLECELVRE
jgi:hypothetical protein